MAGAMISNHTINIMKIKLSKYNKKKERAGFINNFLIIIFNKVS